MGRGTTTSPCRCCGASLAGYYCRALRGTGKFVGFAPYVAPLQYLAPVYYLVGTPSGRMELSWYGDTYSIQAGDDAEFSNCGVFVPGTMSIYDGSMKTGYSCIAEAGLYLPGNFNATSSCLSSLATNIGATSRSFTSSTTVQWDQIVDPFNAPHAAGPLIGKLSQPFTADMAFRFAACNGYGTPEEYEECRAYMSFVNTDSWSSSYQEFEGQSMVVFFTIVNAKESEGMTLTAQFVMAEISSGDIIYVDNINLNFSAPGATFVLKYDVPMPAPGYQYYLNTVTFSTGGPGGAVTYDGDEGAYRIVDP